MSRSRYPSAYDGTPSLGRVKPWVVAVVSAGALVVACGGALAWHYRDYPNSTGCVRTGDLGALDVRLARVHDGVCLDRHDGVVRLRYQEPDASGSRAHADAYALLIWEALDRRPNAVRIQDDAFSDGNVDHTYGTTELQRLAEQHPHAADVKAYVCEGDDYEPTSILIACGDGNVRVTGLRWSSWTTDQAVGTGAWRQNDCKPDCADGRFIDYPVSLVLSEPMQRSGDQVPFEQKLTTIFGRVVATFPQTAPPYPGFKGHTLVVMDHGKPAV
jgi:hypothetical protein